MVLTFAALANEFTEDPGNRDLMVSLRAASQRCAKRANGTRHLKHAALPLDQGQVAPERETDFGFHIIKLEDENGTERSKDRNRGRAGRTLGDTYDVRHILISTGYKDPDSPSSKETPIKETTQSRNWKRRREKKVIDRSRSVNNVQVPMISTIPEVRTSNCSRCGSDRQMPQMPQGMRRAGTKDAPKEWETTLQETGPKKSRNGQRSLCTWGITVSRSFPTLNSD